MEATVFSRYSWGGFSYKQKTETSN